MNGRSHEASVIIGASGMVGATHFATRFKIQLSGVCNPQWHAFPWLNGPHYNAAAAALANGRTSEFLKQQLRSSAEASRL